MFKLLSYLIISVTCYSFLSCTTPTPQFSVDKRGVWTGYAKNLTYKQTANLKLEIDNYDNTSGAASGSALITGSLVGSGKVHGRFTNSTGNFTLIPSSGIGSPISFKSTIKGATMKGTYSLPQQGRIPKQKGVFELVKAGNSSNESISNQVSQRAKQEVELWNYGNGITKNTVRITSSRPGVRIEINGDYKGKTPLTVTIIGTRARNFSRATNIKAYPIHNGGYTQHKYFFTRDRIPSNIYFDMNLVPSKRNRPSVQINVN